MKSFYSSLLILIILSIVPTRTLAADGDYWELEDANGNKIGQGKKCRFDGTRLFKHVYSATNGPEASVESCYAMCNSIQNCHHFSYGVHDSKWMCMGCNGHEYGYDNHDPFTVYELKPRDDWEFTKVAAKKDCSNQRIGDKIPSVTQEECHTLCKDTQGCGYFSMKDMDWNEDAIGSGTCQLCTRADGFKNGKDRSNTYSVLSPENYKPVCEGPTGTVWGDPHFITFDNLRYDCQGRGEYVLVKSNGGDPLAIHGVFEDTGGSATGPSVTRSIAILVDENVPVLQVTIPDMPDVDGNCDFAYTIGENEDPVDADDIVNHFMNEYAGLANVYTNEKAVIVTFPNYQTRIEILVHSGAFSRFGCRMRANICVTPSNHGGEDNIVGLFGSPNGSKEDDWMMSNAEATPITVPVGDRSKLRKDGTDYCRENWCVPRSDSLYDDATYSDHNKCADDSFDPEAYEEMIDALPEEIKEKCQEAENPEECISDVAVLKNMTEEAGETIDLEDVVDSFADEEDDSRKVSDTTEAELYAEDDWGAPNVTTLFTADQIVPTSGPTRAPSVMPSNSMSDFDDIPDDPNNDNDTPNDANDEDPIGDNFNSKDPAGSNGDPHFKTWLNEHYEFHGQCDMVLTRDPNFANGLGFEVQIRTKIVRFWSYIRSAAIRIGDDILEIEGSPDLLDRDFHYWFNFGYQKKTTSIGGFPLSISTSGVTKRFYEIDLSPTYPGQKIILSSFREFISVKFEGTTSEAFGNTVGMLGNYETGKTLSRDGATTIDDFTKLGNEWQVIPSDDMLFHDIAEPQFPKKCIVPEDPRGERRRRLDESKISMEAAEAACQKVLTSPLDIKDCVYDILATQDLDMVGAF